MPKTASVAKSLLVFAALAAASAAPAQLPTITLQAGIYLIHAEVAATFDTRARGLMFRESLAPNEGMLFVFPQVERHCMWMKNTLIPLSVAFMDGGGRIVSIAEMKPQTETSHCAAAPARYALEMRAGWFSSKGIGPGTRILGLDRAPAPE